MGARLGDRILVNLGVTEHSHLRPAVVVEAWDDGVVNVQVFLDGTNDVELVQRIFTDCFLKGEDEAHREAVHVCSRGMLWLTSIHEGESRLEYLNVAG